MCDVYNIYLTKRNYSSVKYIVISYNAKVGNAMSIKYPMCTFLFSVSPSAGDTLVARHAGRGAAECF